MAEDTEKGSDRETGSSLRSPTSFIKDVGQIMDMIPHRYPMLLVDRILEFVRGESLVALKNVTIGEHYFIGHFPAKPVMPGVLIIEALAQASALYTVMDTGVSTADKIVYFMSIEKAKFRKPVVPGDTLYLHVSPIQQRRNVHKLSCEAYVEDTKVTDAVLTAMIADKTEE